MNRLRLILARMVIEAPWTTETPAEELGAAGASLALEVVLAGLEAEGLLRVLVLLEEAPRTEANWRQ